MWTTYVHSFESRRGIFVSHFRLNSYFLGSWSWFIRRDGGGEPSQRTVQNPPHFSFTLPHTFLYPHLSPYRPTSSLKTGGFPFTDRSGLRHVMGRSHLLTLSCTPEKSEPTPPVGSSPETSLTKTTWAQNWSTSFGKGRVTRPRPWHALKLRDYRTEKLHYISQVYSRLDKGPSHRHLPHPRPESVSVLSYRYPLRSPQPGRSRTGVSGSIGHKDTGARRDNAGTTPSRRCLVKMSLLE